MRGTFKAHEVEIIADISVDTQKDLNKKIKAMGLPPLGEGNGHRLYSLADVLFLRLIQLLKTRGLSVANALTVVLEETSEKRRDLEHPATHDIRQRLFAVFATHIVGFEVETDVMLYLPMSGTEPWSSLVYLSAQSLPGSARVVSADPEVTLERVLSLRPFTDDHALCINVSLMTRRFLQHYREHGEGLLAHLDDIAASLKAAFPEGEA